MVSSNNHHLLLYSMRIFHYLFLLFLLTSCSKPPSLDTAKIIAPGAAQSIGFYTNGCLVGAASLPPDGIGYQFMRISRRRFYGHPHLTDFIQTLSRQMVAADKSSMLLIGDMAQPRGGKLIGGHDSHQTGLDVDIWYQYPQVAVGRSLTLDERENLSASSLLDSEGKNINPALWNNHIETMLQKAAEFRDVERIFVNPIIKRKLCEQHKGEAWLHKIRPWWGHEEHFHVRLACPTGDNNCIPQTVPLPKGDGCDATLAWWFTPDAVQTREAKAVQKKEKTLPQPPSICKNL